MLIPSLCIAAALIFWALATWYFADDQPVFGPTNDTRVTFKQVLQGFARDAGDLLGAAYVASYIKRLWAFWGPRLTNRALIALVMGDIGIAASGRDVWAFIGDHPLLIAGIVLMHLLTPVTVPGAPASLPAPDPGGLRGPGAEYEARGGARVTS